MPNFTSFEDIQNLKLDDIEDPKPFPIGTYLWMVQGMPENIKSQQKQTPGIVFKFKPIQAQEDVDRAALDEAGGLQKEITHTFWMPQEGWGKASILRNFLRDVLGIQSGLSLPQAIAESVGRQFKGHITHRPYTGRDGTARLQAEIDTMTPA